MRMDQSLEWLAPKCSWGFLCRASPLSLAEVTWVREVPRRWQAPLTCPYL